MNQKNDPEVHLKSDYDFKCPNCNRDIVVVNKLEKSGKGLVIKNIKLVFLNDNGEILIKCSSCKEISTIPTISTD